MHKLILAALASLFAANVALAQAPAPAPKAEAKPAAAAPAPAPAADCGAQAAEKKLKGAAKSSFMKKCEKDNPAPKAEEKKPEPKADGRMKQQEKMKTCNKEASEKALKGKERKAFMSTCLKG